MEVCEFVNFSMAKKLKEKGFNLHCMPFYALENFIDECVDSCGDCYEVDFEKDILYLNYPLHYKKFEEKMLSAPTISQVLKWFRDKKNIYCLPWFEQGVDMWFYAICTPACGSEFPEFLSESVYDTYEQAAIAGIEYVLDNLI